MAGEGVELVGQVGEEEKHRLLSQAWLLLHPAMFEGWGLVVMEAAAAGTPTLAFRVRGLCDSVVHGGSGMLATSEESFVDHWIALAHDGELRDRLGSGARERARDFAWSSTVSTFLPVVEEAVGLARPAR
jgi:glycosyltransferase involved in cell wall biosynthesis